jgi:phage protein D
MTLLSRITSRDKDRGDKTTESTNKTGSDDRNDVEAKPSLLRRLSRRNSASKDQAQKDMGLGDVSPGLVFMSTENISGLPQARADTSIEQCLPTDHRGSLQ